MAEAQGLKFSETLRGFFAEGIDDFQKAYEEGKRSNNRLEFRVTIEIDNMEDFIKISGRKARLSGRVSCSSLGKEIEIQKGEFNLFEPSHVDGQRRMIYRFFLYRCR